MAYTPRRGRPLASKPGEGSVTAEYAEDVYKTIKFAKGTENRLVQFSEIWPELFPRARHADKSGERHSSRTKSQTENWQKNTTVSALRLLCEWGWIENPKRGYYLDLDSPLAVVHGFRIKTRQVLNEGSSLLTGQLPGERGVPGPDDPNLFRGEMLQWGLKLAYTVGVWSRMIEERLRKQAESLGIDPELVLGSTGDRAGELVDHFGQGYFLIERQNALEKRGLTEFLQFEELTGTPLTPDPFATLSRRKRERIIAANMATAPLWRELALVVAQRSALADRGMAPPPPGHSNLSRNFGGRGAPAAAPKTRHRVTDHLNRPVVNGNTPRLRR